MSSSITDLEFQTFYVVTKLIDSVYPNGKLYLSHGLSTERDSYRYRAAVVESKAESSGSIKRRVLTQVETAKTRIGVLEAVRKRLEEIASWRLDVIVSDKERDDVEENERKRKNLCRILLLHAHQLNGLSFGKFDTRKALEKSHDDVPSFREREVH
ncbi:hypothetical protein J4E93_009115 [Alternaria ventricosa]|uniref:uncharacterized protein n=1 Tax=Alternaria ventricosa TaxID=1187951 RepID=UPI0020C5AE8A|nr:uncharacterized protein J4E93_009115 [Alternaria ventricosa]KAI4639761.1 hypothetical protein J4E93_009115 [Alternaria ventricosa]